MSNLFIRVLAALIVAYLPCASTVKSLGILQQSGYKNSGFWKWLKRKDNLFFNRLSVLALCLALSTAVFSLCFSFAGIRLALLISALPYVGLLSIFWWVDKKYALKVPVVATGRLYRLFALYYAFTFLFAFVLISFFNFLAVINGSSLYALIAYVPMAILPLLLPVSLILANGVSGIFENARNGKFVKRAGQVLDETQITRVAIVGSYGKTSVKNIAKTLLLEKFSVVETPASYNTPMGIAKTVLGEEFSNKQIFLAEMGARKEGDVAELCTFVKPDYAIFTGVCAQHIQTFGSVEKVLEEKSRVLSFVKLAVCGEDLYGKVEGNNLLFAGESNLKSLCLSSTKTSFTLLIDGEELEVETALLGRSAAENIALAATLCQTLGMTKEEIAAGISKLAPIPHRLQGMENNGVLILDDGYNCNIQGAKAALEVLSSHTGRKCIVTPGIVEGGIMEETLNEELGRRIAESRIDRVILVGDTLVGAVKRGYEEANGSGELSVTRSLAAAQEVLATWVERGDGVLFLNDLPDCY